MPWTSKGPKLFWTRPNVFGPVQIFFGQDQKVLSRSKNHFFTFWTLSKKFWSVQIIMDLWKDMTIASWQLQLQKNYELGTLSLGRLNS